MIHGNSVELKKRAIQKCCFLKLLGNINYVFVRRLYLSADIPFSNKNVTIFHQSVAPLNLLLIAKMNIIITRKI